MDPNNPSKKPRTLFVTANKYQGDIIILAFLPSVLIFMSFLCIIFIANPGISRILFHTSLLGAKISANQLSEIIVFVMSSFFILSLIIAFRISHNMVGAFGRIIRELDEIIVGRSQKTIYSRPSDTLTKDLLQRINVLVECYIKHEKKNS